MIDKLIEFSIKNKLVIGLGVIGLIAWGSYSLRQLPIDAVPDITNNQVQVITIAPTIAAQEVERLITFPIELTMATIPDIKEIRSFSRFGLSAVTIVFEEDIDVYWARQQVNERLTEAKSQIPQGIGTPTLAPVTTGLGEIYQYAVHTKKGYEDKYSAMDLRTIQDWTIKRQLLGTEGVADVSSFGGFLKQYEIAINPHQLKSMKVSIADIFTALEKNNQNTGGAYIDKKPNAYFIRSEGMMGSIEDIENTLVKLTDSGQPILIKDVAKVQYGSAFRYGATTRNGEGEVVSAIVMMLKGENSAKVIEKVKLKIAQIEKTLPEGVVIEPFLDRTKLVDNAIGTVTTNLIEGALIVVFILSLFLGNFRAGLIVASVIPLAMLFAISMMNLFGVSGNLMSLGAIDFGLIVDGAVIIVESILLRITTNKQVLSSGDRLNQAQMNDQVYIASNKIRSTAAFGEIIILIVYLPILALVGVEGKMFAPMAQTVSFAILGAFILSLTYVPMMSALALSKKTTHKINFSDKMMSFFQRIYRPIITNAIEHKAKILIVTVVLFIGSLFIYSRLGGEFIPSLDEGDFAVETRVMNGSSLSETIDASLKAQQILLANFPEVEQVVGKIGSGEIPTDPMPLEACDLMIILKDKSEWTSASSRDELADKMATALEVIPGVTFGFQQPIQMRFNELMTGARQDVVIKLYGEDLDVLSDYASQIGALVQTVKGAEDLYVEEVTGLPQIQIDFNRPAIARFGLNISDINTAIETAFAGKSAGLVYEGEKRFDLVVRLNEEDRESISDVSNLFVLTPNGQQVPLNQLAEVSFKDGPSQIQRDDTKRRITIGFNVRNRDVESIVKEIQSKVEAKISLPDGYYATYGGQFQNLIEARERLMIAVPAALLLILTLLYFTFKSMKQSLLIFTAIPLSAIGGIIALYLRDMPFSISAGVGFIALFGVAVLNGIVLIGEFNRLKEEGVEIKERVINGTSVRLRPVLMTAMVASCGFLPMALSTSSGAEVQQPLATVVIGGLITATLLTLIVLPILYMIVESKSIKMKNSSKLTAIICFVGLSFGANSQSETVVINSVDDAITIALERNQNVQTAQLELNWSETQQRLSSDIGKTTVNWQHGQYNSVIKKDNNFSISHTFAFPSLYMNESKFLKSKTLQSENHLLFMKLKITQSVKTAYNEWLFQSSRLKLYEELNTNYQEISKNATLRYEAGDITQLDQLITETNKLDVENQLSIVESEERMALISLKIVLNIKESENLSISDQSLNEIGSGILVNELDAKNSILLASFEQDIIVAQKMQKVEASKALPEISLGYFNQSLIGNQTINGMNQYYGPRDRFQGFQIGLNIPIWFRPNVAKVSSAKIATKIAESNYNLANKELEGEYAKLKEEISKLSKNLNFYKTKGNSQADALLRSARLSLENGEINQFDYAQVMNQCTSIKLKGLDALKSYNEAIIRLELMQGTK